MRGQACARRVHANAFILAASVKISGFLKGLNIVSLIQFGSSGLLGTWITSCMEPPPSSLSSPHLNHSLLCFRGSALCLFLSFTRFSSLGLFVVWVVSVSTAICSLFCSALANKMEDLATCMFTSRRDRLCMEFSVLIGWCGQEYQNMFFLPFTV